MQRRIRTNSLGLSEIVGSLMLVLIVVSAATALGAFVANYQKTLQAEQAVTHDRQLESIKVVTASTYLNKTGANGALLNANFTIASLDQQPMIINGIDLDNQPIRNYTALELDLSSGLVTPVTIAALGQLPLSANEELTVSFDVSAGPTSSFYASTFGLTDRSYLQIDLFTGLSNDFRGFFLPPTAIAIVSALQSFSGSTPITVPVLNGQNSLQPGNGSIVLWSWTVTATPTISGGTWTGFGVEAVPTWPRTPYNYTVNLTVTDNFGLVGLDSITFFHP